MGQRPRAVFSIFAGTRATMSRVKLTPLGTGGYVFRELRLTLQGSVFAMRIPFAALLLVLASLSFGCATTNIPNTDVEDNSDNRKVIQFCEDYRHAVEEKNVGKLLSIASPRYHEDGGNSDDSDDMDLDGLKQYFMTTFVKTVGIRYEIRYRRVTTTQTNRILVDYTYAGSFKIAGAKGMEWRHTVADNRLELVPDGESFKIIAGM